ncbi:MAG: DNA mismatch repair protein MutH [Polyangiaceae bacterium]
MKDAARRARPPQSVEELLARAHALEGRPLGALATESGVGLGPGGVHSKGKPGVLLEAVLGATGGSNAVHDFEALGVELKSLPVTAGTTSPLESTYVCVVPADDADRVEFDTSWLRRKLACVLFVPILARSRKEPFGERVIGRAFLWTPNDEELAVLRADFEDIMGAIALGGAETLTAHVGRVLQARPKAATGSVRMTLVGPDGEPIETIPRGFYLRPSFTETLLRRASVS